MRNWTYVEMSLSQTKSAQQCVVKVISLTAANLVTPKNGAKNEFWFNNPTPELLGLLKVCRGDKNLEKDLQVLNSEFILNHW